MSTHVIQRIAAFLFTALMLACGSARADMIYYQATALGGSSWRYDYTIAAGTPTAGFDEVTIFFDPTRYSLLNTGTAPAGWDPLLIQPDPGIPADGYFDVLHLAGLLVHGETFTGFSVNFNYLGAGTPGEQSFELYDSSDFSLRGSGTTTLEVPEPNSGALLLVGLGCLALPGLRRLWSLRGRPGARGPAPALPNHPATA